MRYCLQIVRFFVAAPFLVFTCWGALGTTAATAAGTAPEFVFEMPMLKYASGTNKTTDDVTKKTSSAAQSRLQTAALEEAYISATFSNGLVAYFYPFTDTASFSIGNFFMKNLELGVDLGLNMFREGSIRANRTILGAYGTFFQPLGKQMLEINAVVDTIKTSQTSRASADAALAKSEGSELIAEFGVGLVHNCTENFQYVGGLSYTYTSKKDKPDGKKQLNGALTVKLAAVRMTL